LTQAGEYSSYGLALEVALGRLDMDDLLAIAPKYVSHFVVWVMGVATLFTFSACTLAWWSSRSGRSKLTDGGPRWYVVLSLGGAGITGVIIGLVVGVQVAAMNAGLELASDAGSAIVSRGIEMASHSIGYSRLQGELSPEQLKTTLSRVDEIELVNDARTAGAILNGAFENIRGPFVDRARDLIEHMSPDERMTLSHKVHSTWTDVEVRMAGAARASMFTRIGLGYLWLGGFGAGALLFSWLVRAGTRRASLAKARLRTSRLGPF
jgi:hypothetical protein